MDFLSGTFATLLSFLFVLSVLVFVHELGHYLVARWNGVKVEVFSIGFGSELFGWNDKSGTRWKVSLLPLGGYVKMYGDMDPASMLRDDDGLSDDQRAQAFHHKTVGQRAAIVFAGPAVNFLFAIVLYAILFTTVGQQQRYLATVGVVTADSPAAAAGFMAGDDIVAVDGVPLTLFEDLRTVVRANPGRVLEVTVLRDDQTLVLRPTPEPITETAADGSVLTVGRLGIAPGAAEYFDRANPVAAVGKGVYVTYDMTARTLAALGEMVAGDRDAGELGGPIRIAQMSGQVAEGGLVPLLNFMAYLSISLGLINLFPIPMLDGGHLVFYAVEVVRGRPLGARAQEYGFRMGAVLVFSLIVFATWNDLSQLGLWRFLSNLLS